MNIATRRAATLLIALALAATAPIAASAAETRALPPVPSAAAAFAHADVNIASREDSRPMRHPERVRNRTPGATFDFIYDESVSPEVRSVMAEAAREWGQVIESSVPILIVVRQYSEPNPDGYTAVSYTSSGSWTSNPPAPQQLATMYPTALMNAAAGEDIYPAGRPNSFADPACAAASCDDVIYWYQSGNVDYSLHGRLAPGSLSALSLALHEIGHGLGFDSGVWDCGTSGFGFCKFSSSLPTAYDRFLVTAAGVPLVNLTGADLYSAITSTNVSFDGPTADSVTGTPLRVAAPPEWLPSTSLSHFYSIYNPDALMIPGFQAGKRYGIDTRTTAVLQDLSWRMHNTVSVRPLAHAGFRGTVWFRVILDQAASVPVVVNYHTADGTATAGKDYIAVSGRLTIPVGQRSIDIRVKTSTAQSSSGRTLSLILDHAAAADLGAASTATATIGRNWTMFWG